MRRQAGARLSCQTFDSTSMTEEVRVSPDGTHILVRSAGPPSLGEMKRTLARIVELRRDQEIDKVLIDSRARSGQPSMADIYNGGELLAKTLGYRTRVLCSSANLQLTTRCSKMSLSIEGALSPTFSKKILRFAGFRRMIVDAHACGVEGSSVNAAQHQDQVSHYTNATIRDLTVDSFDLIYFLV